MRLFIALDIDDAIRDRISLFLEGVNGFASDARWVRPESLHVTLKFIGEQPESAVDPIKHTLSDTHGSASEIHFRGYGFFPTAKSARVFWIGLEAGPQLADPSGANRRKNGDTGNSKRRPRLQSAPDAGPWRRAVPAPRAGAKQIAPNRIFQRLQEKLAALPAPEFGTMTAREFFLYQSQLSPKGSKYTKLARFNLQ